MSVRRRDRITAVALGSLLAIGGLALTSPVPALADTAPVAPGEPATVSADALPTVQVDGVVWSQTVVGNTVYAAGSFTSARPAGAAAGTSTTPRGNLLAYDITTGALVTSFAPSLNGQARTVAASPDGSRIYVGGDFTSANGASRYRIAAYSTSTGQLISTFAPKLDYTVKAIVATNDTVYVGGAFSSANGVARSRLAAFSAANGALLSWNPSADSTVNAMVMAPDQSRLVVGGAFQNLGSTPAYGLGAVDLSGNPLPWAANTVVRDAGANSAILSLTTDGTKIYGSGYVYSSTSGEGNLEGSFAADPDSGTIAWIEDCHGDTYGTFPTGGALYIVGHPHFCGNINGFPQTNPWTFHNALAFTTDATQTVQHSQDGNYFDFGGQPAPSLLTWFPDFTPGTYTGQKQATWSVSGNGSYVVMGGEFPKVNGTAQQGLVRFAVRSAAPNKQGPRVSGPALNPSLVSLKKGSVRVAWQADWDRDNALLTYKLVRDGNTAAPVYQTTQSSTFWNRPMMGFVDTGLVPGQTYKYRLYVTDPLGNTVSSDAVSVTAASTDSSSAYSDAVTADSPTLYYRLDEAAGTTTAYDYAGYADGVVSGGVTAGGAGALGDTSTSYAFDGSTGLVATPTAVQGPNTFTAEAWFRTTTTKGGKILGFGNLPSGASNSYDRHVYMDTSGRLTFGVYNNGFYKATSAGTYNDGAWHQVVATLGPNGMALYVDAKRVAVNGGTTVGQNYPGYWRIGGDNLSGWTSASSSFAGSVDEVAIYPTALSASRISAHYAASGRGTTTSSRPSDAYGQQVYDASPEFYWRLGETSGTTARDITGNGDDGAYTGGYTLGATGVAGTAVTLDGVNGLVTSTQQEQGPQVYSEELWFKTTTTRGGKLIGFGTNPTGPSSSYDRHVYMLDTGQLRFGVWTGQTNTVDTPNAYNDGQWHHLVATQGPDGMKLYVDGSLTGTNPQTAAQDYAGYWRVGGDTAWGGNSSDYFAGTIDEVAVYPSVLTASQVSAHYAAGTGAPAPTNQAPTAAFTSSATGLSAAVDGSGSTDPDGTIARYSWDFGDGSPAGTGATATHAYASAGTYTITLTVTDNQGATATAKHDVTVTAPNQAPTAAFTASATGLTAAVDGSGSTDPDGTIARYSWDFGDGTSGAGAKTTHAYAAAGTYTVTLTVTDDGGATGTVSHSMTVTAPVPPAPSVLAQDAFSRTVTGGFGTADVGGAWGRTGTASSQSVSGGVGQLAMTAGTSSAAYLGSVSATDTDTTVSVSLDRAQTGGGTYVSVIGRRLSASTDYRVKLKYASTGAVTAVLEQVTNSTETALKSVTVPGVTYAAGDVLHVRLQVYGTAPTTLAVKVWKDGTTEPTTWLATATDSTAGLQAAGGIGLLGYLSGSATTPMTASFDDLQVAPHA